MHKSIAAVATVAIIISSKWMIGTLIIFSSSSLYLLYLAFTFPIMKTKQKQTHRPLHDSTSFECYSTSEWIPFVRRKQVSSPLCLFFCVVDTIIYLFLLLLLPLFIPLRLILCESSNGMGRNFNFQHFEKERKNISNQNDLCWRIK